MISHFNSHFAKQMEDMLEFKEALGYSRNSYDKFLLNFDSFCIYKFPNETTLTKELVMEWGRVRSNENSNGVKRRLIAIREFGKYLNSIGLESYVIPPDDVCQEGCRIKFYIRYLYNLFQNFQSIFNIYIS